jgi:CheY-like chemotaxis protein
LVQLSLSSLPTVDIVRLLAAEPGGQANVVDVKPERTTRTRMPRVLVVDDEKLVADSLSEILKRFHYDAVAFYSGEAAIEAARQQCPDFVLSDVMMPRLNGVETVLRIQEICPGTRILLLSGNAATADLLQEARSEGHEFELLAKPIHPEELLRRLH